MLGHWANEEHGQCLAEKAEHVALFHIGRYPLQGKEWKKHNPLFLNQRFQVAQRNTTGHANWSYFTLRAVVSHVGEERGSGHYTCGLVAGDIMWYCDDGEVPQLVEEWPEELQNGACRILASKNQQKEHSKQTSTLQNTC